MTTGLVDDLRHSWNPRSHDSPEGLGDGTPSFNGPRVEDDIREALHCVSAQRPTLEQRRALLDLSARVGIHVSLLGFPGASPQEHHDCTALVTHIQQEGLALAPVLAARIVPEDVYRIVDIQQQTSAPLAADFHLSTSPVRAAVEGWHLATRLARLEAVARLAATEGLPFRVAFRDSTRTPRELLTTCVQAALAVGAPCLVLNDTAGDCLPAGARRHTAFVVDLIRDAGHRVVHDPHPSSAGQGSKRMAFGDPARTDQGGSGGIELAWRGHNDKGLALANSLAAIEAGATLIGGTFLGIGERAGILALEQLLAILTAAGDSRYDLTQLVPIGELVASALGIEIAPNMPILGADVFSTATGAHAATILKGRQLGPDVEDLVYSAVAASLLGRQQRLLAGPYSGLTGVQAVLQDLDLPHDDDTGGAVLQHARTVGRTLTDGEIIRIALHDRRGA